MSFLLQLETLIIEAQNAIENAVSLHGKEESFSDSPVFDVSSLNIISNDGIHITHVSQSCLFDQHGYIYNHDVLTTVDLFNLADYLASI